MDKAYVCNKCGVVFEPKETPMNVSHIESLNVMCPVCKESVGVHRTEMAEFGE